MKFQQSLSWQLLKSVLSIYFSITAIITIIQMGIEYFHTRSMVQAELKGAERTFYPALATALWELNREQLDALLQGITDLPLISAARVHEQSGQETQRGTDQGLIGAAIEHSFPVSYHFSGQDVLLAQVSFTASDAVVLQRLQVGFQMIVISAAVKSTLLSALFIWAFRRHLGRPLRDLTRAVAAMDLESLGRNRVDLRLDRQNELSGLQDAFNRMLATLDRERQAHVRTLVALNQSLESQVKLRTQELEEANRRLEQLVRTDPLTGLANRRHFIERLSIDIRRSQRTHAPLSLLAVDLDHFKRVNDRWGHDAGDLALCNFARTASSQLRTTDLLARLGGEEFIVLLPDTPRDKATEVAQRVLTSVRAQSIDAGSARFGYTVSIGVADLDPQGDDCDSLLKKADQAMYRAKETGRDRVAVQE